MRDITAFHPCPFEQVAETVAAPGLRHRWRPLLSIPVASAAPLRWPEPFCLLGPCDEEQRRLLRQREANALPVTLARLRGARVVGRGLLLDRRDRLLTSPHFHDFAPRSHPQYEQYLWNWLELDQGRPPDAVARRAPEALTPLRLPGAFLLLAQPGDRVFGHWLLEILPRLALAQQLGLGHLPLLMTKPLPSFAPALLALLGVGEAQLRLYDVHREMPCPALLYVPSRLFLGTHIAPLAGPLFDRIAAGTQPRPLPGGRRLFLSRGGLGPQMRHVNRAALLPLMERHGFVELRPETLPAAEQVRLLAEASHVIAEDGSAAHLTLFCPPGTSVLILSATGRSPRAHYAVAALRGHRIGFVFGTPQPSAQSSHIDHRIEPLLLEQALAQMLEAA